MAFRIVVLFVAALSCSCSEKPSPPAPPEPMVQVHADLLILGEEGRLRGLDSAALRQQTDSCLEAHGISRGEYEASLRQLREDLTVWKAFSQAVVKRLEAAQREAQPHDSAAGKPAKPK